MGAVILASGNVTSSGNITIPSGTTSLIVATKIDGNNFSSPTFNSVALTQDAEYSRTYNRGEISSLFDPDIGTHSLSFAVSIRYAYWWACSGLGPVLSIDQDEANNTSPLTLSLNIVEAYSAFCIGGDYFGGGNEITETDWNEVVDAVTGQTFIIGQYEGSGGTGISANMTNSGSSDRIGFCGVSYKVLSGIKASPIFF